MADNFYHACNFYSFAAAKQPRTHIRTTEPAPTNQYTRAVSRDQIQEELLRDLLIIFPNDEARVRAIIQKNPKITDLNMLTDLLLTYREKY